MRAREHYIAEDGTLFLKCSKCGIFKPAKEYNKGKKCFMGLQPKCRECQHMNNKEHYNNNSDIYSKSKETKSSKFRKVQRTRKEKKEEQPRGS